MQRRGRWIWWLFAFTVGTIFVVMGWVTRASLELESQREKVQREASHEETVRLALWRMDAVLAPTIARETARPYFEYSSFYPANRAYTRMFSSLEPGEILLPSPLLAAPAGIVKFHFQVGPDGVVSSPQVPKGNMRDLAESGYVEPAELMRVAARFAEFSSRQTAETLVSSAPPVEETPAPMPIRATTPKQDEALANAALEPTMNLDNSFPAQQRLEKANSVEYESRNALVNQAAQAASSLSNVRRKVIPGKFPSKRATKKARAEEREPLPERLDSLRQGVMRAVWLGEDLVLLRTVQTGEDRFVQGCVLDWSRLQRELLVLVEDLLPNAGLKARGQGGGDQGRQLASLPVDLSPGPMEPSESLPMGGLHLSLVLAWVSLFLGMGLVAWVIHASMQLSERRGAFVSAVTHELRTPLSTFRMYTEMLEAGMVTDPAKQREYYHTLGREAERLDHLVQNVLAFSRLEKRGLSQFQEMDLPSLLERCLARPRERALEGSLVWKFDTPSPDLELAVLKTDPEAVERILFNLVDNAAKYAGAGELRVRVERAGRTVALHLADDGPGLPASIRSKLFVPFSRSASQSAGGVPGVGLGLALSRRLARELGGELRWVKEKAGTHFVLTLPVEIS